MWDQPSHTPTTLPCSPGIETLIELEIGPGPRVRSRLPVLGHRQTPSPATGRATRAVVTWPLAQVARISPPPNRPPPEAPETPSDE